MTLHLDLEDLQRLLTDPSENVVLHGTKLCREEYDGFFTKTTELADVLALIAELKAARGEIADLTQDVEAYHSDTLTLMAERDKLRTQLEKARKDAFTHGYLIAVANLMNLHDSEVEAEDVLRELGETEGVIKRLDLAGYDAKPLRKLFRENSRKAKQSARRAANLVEATGDE